MSTKVKLLAGTPNDGNRDYLPLEIKGSDMVVNENGNNSQPYPQRLVEFHDELGGVKGTWYEYVPGAFENEKNLPLVISAHGGLMTGWGQAIYTSWTYAAEKYGFICVFPDAYANTFFETELFAEEYEFRKEHHIDLPYPPADVKDNHDCNFILGLIERMKEKYNIDPGRIFMQGMSGGNIFTHFFARHYGAVLAGAAGSGGPQSLSVLFNKDGSFRNWGGHLAIWQSRPEHNGFGMKTPQREADINKYNRFYWLKINQCDPIPEISIIGEDNFAFYKGEKADLVFLDIRNRDHGQALDEAYLYWEYLFSGTRRLPDGTILQGETIKPRKGDANAAAFQPGVAKVWWHNRVEALSQPPVKWQKLKYHGQGGKAIVRGEYLCVPLAFLARAAGAQYSPSEDGTTAVVTLKDGRELQFARGSIGCMIDDSLRCMSCEAIHRSGELLVSVEWFSHMILGWTVSEYNDVVYITDHHAELSFDMADLIKDLFRGFVLPDDYTNLEKIRWDGK